MKMTKLWKRVLVALACGISMPVFAQGYEPVELDVLSKFDEYPCIHVDDGDIWIYGEGEDLGNDLPFFGAQIAHHAVEMMWKYGTTKHSVEEYRRRATINYVMLGERSSAHDVIDYIFQAEGHPSDGDNEHAACGFSTIWPYIDHIRPISCNSLIWHLYMTDLVADLKAKYGDDVRIVTSNSTGAKSFEKRSSDWIDLIPSFQSPNMISFAAIGNITKKYCAVVQNDSDLPGEKFYYATSSFSNPPDTIKVRNYPVVGMNYLMDYTISTMGSSFPYGFYNDYVIGSMSMPYTSLTSGGVVVEEAGNTQSSYNTTSTACRIMLCAQVWPDLEDLQEIMDYFAKRRDNKVPVTWVERDLHADITCIHVGEFFRDKAMPTEVPTEVSASGSVPLPRGVYPGVLFSGPGVTVKAGDQWIAVTKENQAIIEGLDPMNLECSFDPSLAMSQGYTDKVEIEAIAIDDTFLALDKGVKYTITINNQQ